MKDEPLVSVVMPVFNGEKYLSQAIDSILNQTFRDFEFIIIDDGSADGTAKLLQLYARKDARIRILSQRNQGLISTLNRGCEESRGHYIARMDADDISVPDRFAKQVAFLGVHPEVAVVGGAAQFINDQGLLPDGLRHPTESAEVAVKLQTYCALAHPTVMMRRKVVKAVGGYRIAFPDAEDYDLWLRIAEGHDLANLPDIVLHYRLHANQVSNRHCCQQALSTVAAQMCSNVRRTTGKDPVTNHVSGPVNLLRIGVPPTTIEWILCGSQFVHAQKLLRDGRVMDASNLGKEIYRWLIEYQSARPNLSEIARFCGKACLVDRKYLQATRWFLRAYWFEPQRILKMIKARTRWLCFAAGARSGIIAPNLRGK
jgi:glycosyltransferase involved in cell wall biosynthesis